MDDELDQLTSQLCEGFLVDPKALGEHPRYSKFKNHTKAAEQQAKRREEALERQKNGLFDKLLKLRKLAFDDLTSDEEDGEDDEKMEETEKTNQKRRGKYYGQLMLSEWLVDIPDTLSSEWTMVMAPVGKRTLVVASRGCTMAYNKAGWTIDRFHSKLPGGSCRSQRSWTILDCIYADQVYHVLDLLSWNGCEYAENPYDFRQFMLKSKLDENPELAKSTTGFRNTFVYSPRCPCDKEQMKDLMKNEIRWPLDGLLFYHNSVVYEPVQSPLVGWLKPWMLPEILGVDVPAKYQSKGNGQTTASFIEKYNQKHGHHSQIDQ